MPRRKVDKPTHIYWLIDIRPEIIAAGWGSGQPFYCGKTVQSVGKRIVGHRYSALRRPHGKIGARLLECKDFVFVRLMEVVPSDGDWVAREKHWIRMLRHVNPHSANVSDGGEGNAGCIVSEKTKAILRAQRIGKPLTLEHRQKLSLAKLGKPGHIPTAAELEKRSKAQRGRIITLEHREKLRLANLGKKQSEETKAKRAAKHRGMKRPTGTGYKIWASRRANAEASENA